MFRCSTRHLLLAIVLAAGFLWLARADRWGAACLAIAVGVATHRVGLGARRRRRRGAVPSAADWAVLVAGSAFQACLGVVGALTAFWSVAWWLYDRSGGQGHALVHLGAGSVAALIVLVVLADPFLWWAEDDPGASGA